MRWELGVWLRRVQRRAVTGGLVGGGGGWLLVRREVLLRRAVGLIRGGKGRYGRWRIIGVVG